MKADTMMLLQEALKQELAYYQQISGFLTELPARFKTQSQADNTIMDLISVLEIEGTTRRLGRDHAWKLVCTEMKQEGGESRLSADMLQRLGYEETARLLVKVQQWAHIIQRQLVKVVVFLKRFNGLNQQLLLLHDSLANPAYTGRGLVRSKPGPRHMDQEA